MPPLPTDIGGGPGQTLTMRCEVRLSAYVPQVSHHCIVPAITKTCFLPWLTGPVVNVAALVSRGFTPQLPHLEAASFALEEDLGLHLVHSQQWPDRASPIVCPPLEAGILFLVGLAALLLLPSTPALFAALFLWAATAFHLEASESLKGNCGWLPAAWVATPIYLALAFTASKAAFHLLTSSPGTL